MTLLSMVASLGVTLDAVSASDAPGRQGVSIATPPAGPAGSPGSGRQGPSVSAASSVSSGSVGTVGMVVGLGDSVPAGSACDCATYVSLVGQGLATRQGTEVVSRNLAAAGLTTKGLLDQLADDAAEESVVEADVTIITIGANDFDSASIEDDACGPDADLACFKDDLAQLRANMDAILRRVRALEKRDGSRIIVTGYWNVFMDGAVGRAQGQAYVTTSDRLTLAVNETLAAAAAAAGARYVDLYVPFKGADGTRDDTELLADDGDHPDATGHRLIAGSVLSALYDV
ncbi:SGNH/GDSL hydrolase family protein [Sphaerisporangium sp. NPDC049002]|uniref:SGNH/GDSL hydrolase family protein n=1 Tax=Sphaerisporangium sp. NPDC049002 TaxID=3155392 RepID=UPI0034066130